MKKFFLFLPLVLVSFMPLVAEDEAEAPVPLADPFILNEGGIYYAYGTFSPDGIVVLVSDDLKTWSWPEGRAGYLALDRKDSYGDKWFWAPEVYRTGDRYLMYYSADEHICCAVSKSPLGPFRQISKRPMSDEKGIDNSLFIDSDGRPYIFWVKFNGCMEIWMAELQPDLCTIKEGTERFCISMSQVWEKVWPSVNEGPFVLKHDGKYYLTYSANSYESKLYGIGYAVSDSVKGPWEKYPDNPILCSPEGLCGTGHHCFFKKRNGKLMIAFHSHLNQDSIHPRIMHIANVSFKKGRGSCDKLVIDPDYFTPLLKK